MTVTLMRSLARDGRTPMKVCYALCLCVVAFGGSLGAQAADQNRFRDPEGITADPTGLLRDPSVRAFPKYPREFMEKGIAGSMVAAYVIDTTGRVELETASFVKSSRREFVKAVCDLLPKLRFQPFLVGDQKWRVLLVESFAFNNKFEADARAIALAKQSQEEFSTKPIVNVVKQLVSLPHCD